MDDATARVGDLAARVEAFARAESLLAEGDRVLVAVSGGADSLCLLDVLLALRETWRLTIGVAHFDHRLRPESAEDAAFVAAWCERLALPVSVGVWLAAADARGRGGLEAAAHRARYAFLLDAARSTGAERVAFGHTADDQVETVLMHLLRGAGLRGLVGLAPRSGAMIRPLLVASAAETRGWCRARGIAWREDASNAEPVAFRNALRRDLVPALRRLNPALDRAVSRTAEALRVDLAFMRESADDARASCVERRGDAFVIERAAYIRLPEAVRRHLIQGLFEDVLPEGRAGDYVHVVAADRLVVEGQTGAAVSLPGGAHVRLEYDVAVLERPNAGPAGGRGDQSSAARSAAEQTRDRALEGNLGEGITAARSEAVRAHCTGGDGPAGDGRAGMGRDVPIWQAVELPIPGSVEPMGAGWSIVASWSPEPDGPPGSDPSVAWLDAARVRPPLLVRPWEAGDRFVPSGMRHSQKLHDLFVNAKIPRNRRRLVPVVLSGGEIVWVGGVRLAETARLRFDGSNGRRTAIRLELRPLPGGGDG